MHQKILKTIPVLLLILFYNCTTIKIRSNKENSYNQPLKKVFVITQSDAKATKLIQKISNRMLVAFKNAGIEGRVSSINSLSIQSKIEHQQKIESFLPKHIMHFKQTKINYRDFSIVNNINFAIQIVEYSTNNIVWKGELEINGQVGIESSIENYIEKLMQQLAKDKIINT